MSHKVEQIRNHLIEHNHDAMVIMSDLNRRYLSDFTGSSGALLITQDNEYLVTDFRYFEQATEQSDFQLIKQTGKLTDQLNQLIDELKLQTIQYESHLMTVDLYNNLNRDHIEMVPNQQIVETIRQIKSPKELELIEKACQIADKTYSHILKFSEKGKTEIEIKNEIERVMRDLGASGASFDIIVASGHRGALPHGVASDKKLEQGDMVTLDFGCFYKGYASDMTRTFSVGEPSKQMIEIYNIVLAAEELALKQIKPGMTAKEADKIARDYITEHGYGDAFGHSLGHSFGLDVHETPVLSSKVDTVLKEGMVVTVEPGIYVEGVGGVRIEDDCLVNSDGLKRLTHSTKELIYV